MGKYKTTRDCIHAVNKAKDPHELKNVLRKYYPDAFINWDQGVAKIGDILSRIVDGKKIKYLIVKTHNNKSAFLYLGNSTLWKNFSSVSVMPFGNAVRKSYLVHRLLAIVFIPNPNNYKYVNHIDGDKSNCTLSNLEWCTSAQNQVHAYRIGLKKPGKHKTGQNAHKAILDDSDVIDIKYRLSIGELSRDLAKEYEVSQACLSNIKTGKRWSHIKTNYGQSG